MKIILEIYSKQVKLDTSVNFIELANLCENFTGADIKALVCDALIRAFHRIYEKNNDFDDQLDVKWSQFYTINKSNDNIKSQEDLLSNIYISQDDFLTSLNTIEKSINKSERLRLNKM